MNSKYVIYLIYNKITGDRYIGSTKNLNRRIICHFSSLELNKHGNDKLQTAYNQYGKDAFDINILQSVENEKDLKREEQKWIDCCNPEYNITSPDNPFSDKAHTKEIITKSHETLSETLKVHYKTKRGKARRKHQSEIMKQKWNNGEFNSGLSHDDRVRIGRLGSLVRQSNGYKHSEETKTKISLATKRTYVGAVSPDGIIYAPIIGMQDFCKEHDLELSLMVAVMHNRRKHHKGWTKYTPEEIESS